jgi:phosphoribosylformylglycinamidine synthase
MRWRGREIVGISRAFLDTNGAEQRTSVRLVAPDAAGLRAASAIAAEALKTAPRAAAPIGGVSPPQAAEELAARWLKNLAALNVCSQKGLVQRFDSTVGSNTVLMPFGGRRQLTPVEGMAAKLPVPCGKTKTATLMSYGFDPAIFRASPFSGAVYAVTESLAKIAALGGDVERARRSFQEYFEKPGADPLRWGKPFSALLGALHAQTRFELAAIGGKDSMSGSFRDLDVPPTLVSFALAVADADHILSPEFKRPGSAVALLATEADPAYPGAGLPDIKKLKAAYRALHTAAKEGKVLSATPVRAGGVAAAVSMMCFGNELGFDFCALPRDFLFEPLYGSIVIELAPEAAFDTALPGVRIIPLGRTSKEPRIAVPAPAAAADTAGAAGIDTIISLDDAILAWEAPLSGIFPEKSPARSGTDASLAPACSVAADTAAAAQTAPAHPAPARSVHARPGAVVARPRALVIAMPGTNCEYESAYAFERAGALTEICVVRNLTSADVAESVRRVAERIRQSHIVMLPGGFSAGDEPDGSGKFMATFFRSAPVWEAVTELLESRSGLMLGICNGFQALVKLGLLPYGKITAPAPDSPTLTFNRIGRFVSRAVDIAVGRSDSPWLSFAREGEVYTVPVAHAEGRFFADAAHIAKMRENRQIATQYVGPDGRPTMEEPYNPNGSVCAIEGITSPDGRIFGKMGHAERSGPNVQKNIYGNMNFDTFRSGVKYFCD